MKECTKCKETKELHEFGLQSGRADGLRPWCKICHSEGNKKYYYQNREQSKVRTLEWHRSNPDKRAEITRKSKLKGNYGITPEQYDELLLKQNECCYVCQRHQDTFKIKLAVDHDHKTKEIRGLLCSFCNRYVIGRHRDSSLFKRAAEYLEGPFTGWIVPEKKRKKKRKKKNG